MHEHRRSNQEGGELNDFCLQDRNTLIEQSAALIEQS